MSCLHNVESMTGVLKDIQKEGLPIKGSTIYAQTPENLETVSIQALIRAHVLACCPQNRS